MMTNKILLQSNVNSLTVVNREETVGCTSE